MAGSNERRNREIMNKFIKELKQLPKQFDGVSEDLLNETISVAEIYAKDLTSVVTGDARAKWQTNINYGHRMEPHFVPGEWVGDVFDYDPSAKTGVIMGARTKYVKGKFMLEKASGRAEKYMIKRANVKIEAIKKEFEK